MLPFCARTFHRMEALVLILIAPLVHAAIQHPEEWQLWKSQHGKSYQSQREELERHLIWLANREYINGHNKNSHEIGYSLQLNQFADWVSFEENNQKSANQYSIYTLIDG